MKLEPQSKRCRPKMAYYDWTQFKRQVFIAANPQVVFDAWAKPGEIVKWFIAQAEYTTPEGVLRGADETVQKGDQYFWRWHQDLEARGEILSVEEFYSLAFTFGEKEPGSEEKVLVIIRVSKSEQGDTVLELTQENMADTLDAYSNWHMGCNLGWSFFMTNLKAYLEHGVDLRETDPERAYASRAITLEA